MAQETEAALMNTLEYLFQMQIGHFLKIYKWQDANSWQSCKSQKTQWYYRKWTQLRKFTQMASRLWRPVLSSPVWKITFSKLAAAGTPSPQSLVPLFRMKHSE